MGMSEKARKAAQILVDYSHTLPRHEQAFVSMYLTKIPTAAYEKVGDLFEFVAKRW